MAELVVVKLAPERVGSLREPLPQRVKLANFFDHITCELLLARIPEAMKATPNVPG